MPLLIRGNIPLQKVGNRAGQFNLHIVQDYFSMCGRCSAIKLLETPS